MQTKKYLAYLIRRKINMVKHLDLMPDDKLFIFSNGPSYGTWKVYVKQYLKYDAKSKRNLKYAQIFLLFAVLVQAAITTYFYAYYTVVSLNKDIPKYGSELSRYRYDWTSIIAFILFVLAVTRISTYLLTRVRWMNKYSDFDTKRYLTKIKEIKKRNKIVESRGLIDTLNFFPLYLIYGLIVGLIYGIIVVFPHISMVIFFDNYTRVNS